MMVATAVDPGAGDVAACAGPQVFITCIPWQIASNKADDVVEAAGGNILDKIAASFAKSAVDLFAKLLTWWLDAPIINGQLREPLPGEAAQGMSPYGFLISHTSWIAGAAAVFGLLLAAGKLALSRNGESLKEALSGLVTLVVVSAVSVQALQLAADAGDAYSTWIMDRALEGNPQGALTKAITMATVSSGFTTGPAVVLIASIIALFSCLIQMILLLVRVVMLVLAAGVLPLAAAASTTPDGKAWFRKILGWLLAYLLYEPVAATIYAVGFRGILGRTSQDQMIGISLILMAVFVLPALMRFFAPMTGALASGGGSGAAVVGGGVALGARAVPSLRGAKGGGSSGAQPAAARSTAATGAASKAGPAGAVIGAVTNLLKRGKKTVNDTARGGSA